MASVADISGLVSVISSSLPEIIAFIKSLHAANNPGQPPPTDAQVLAALLQAGTSTIAIDENWKASHP